MDGMLQRRDTAPSVMRLTQNGALRHMSINRNSSGSGTEPLSPPPVAGGAPEQPAPKLPGFAHCDQVVAAAAGTLDSSSGSTSHSGGGHPGEQVTT